MKVWGAVIIDKNTGAVDCNIVLEYSALEVIKMFRSCRSLTGLPAKISSDPDSQLDSASGGTGAWWKDISKQLLGFTESFNFT